MDSGSSKISWGLIESFPGGLGPLPECVCPMHSSPEDEKTDLDSWDRDILRKVGCAFWFTLSEIVYFYLK